MQIDCSSSVSLVDTIFEGFGSLPEHFRETCLFFTLNLFSPLQIYPAMDMDSANSVVLQALTQATSQDTAVLKPAEEQLRQWETQPGFYSVLLVKNDVQYLTTRCLKPFLNVQYVI